ncbi:MAG: ChbG/HpnK family deacetylase [Nakamurella sp.]
MSRLLIISADDFGLTDGVCRAVLAGHQHGIVTSTSLLAVGRSFETAVEMLRDTPSLDAGAHLAIVGEDPPLLTAREIPTLVDSKGAFPLSYRSVVLRGVVGRIDPADVRREFGAQLQRILDAGVPVSHLDTHQHTHLWPAVGTAVLELAVANNIRAVRTPHSGRQLPIGFGVNLLAGRFRTKVGRAGLATTAGYAGLVEAGTFDQARFEHSLGRFGPPEGTDRSTVEINTHPGEAGDADLSRFDWGYRWPAELAMLLAPASRELIQKSGFRLGSFQDLVTVDGPA